MSVWHLYPLTAFQNTSTPSQHFNGSTPPDASALVSALGIDNNSSPTPATDVTVTKVLEDYYLFSYGYLGAPCVFSLIRTG